MVELSNVEAIFYYISKTLGRFGGANSEAVARVRLSIPSAEDIILNASEKVLSVAVEWLKKPEGSRKEEELVREIEKILAPVPAIEIEETRVLRYKGVRWKVQVQLGIEVGQYWEFLKLAPVFSARGTVDLYARRQHFIIEVMWFIVPPYAYIRVIRGNCKWLKSLIEDASEFLRELVGFRRLGELVHDCDIVCSPMCEKKFVGAVE